MHLAQEIFDKTRVGGKHGFFWCIISKLDCANTRHLSRDFLLYNEIRKEQKWN